MTESVRDECPAKLWATATHFKANALGSLIACELEGLDGGDEFAVRRRFWERRDLVREARVLQLEVCNDPGADEVLRSLAACWMTWADGSRRTSGISALSNTTRPTGTPRGTSLSC